MSLMRSRFGPWSGLVVAAVAWSLHHQLGSQAAFGHCLPWQGPATALLGLAFVLLTLVVGWLSWRARTSGVGRPQTRQFAGILSLAGAGLFSLAMLYQTAASLIVPVCLS